MSYLIQNLIRKLCKDGTVQSVLMGVVLFSTFTSLYISWIFGIVVISAYITGCAATIAGTRYIIEIHNLWLKVTHFFRNDPKYISPITSDCDVCGDDSCIRHKITIDVRPPWKGLMIDKDLDRAISKFYTRILNSFVNSWFSVLSTNDEFVYSLKHNLRESTCHLMLKLQNIDYVNLLTEKLLPRAISHHELIQKLIKDDVPMKQLSEMYVLNEYPIHPATINRQSELDYLRAISKFLIPRLCCNEIFDSQVFFSLTRELLACWVLLPMMDVISDPNLINLLIVTLTNVSQTRSYSNKLNNINQDSSRVQFLYEFIKHNDNETSDNSDSFLNDQTELYSFMKFLKKEGAVDYLRFYLDVNCLNNELLDPKITTDPAKLSSLYQQSETLLKTYKLMIQSEVNRTPPDTLATAAEDVKQMLQGKWQKIFHGTDDYFNLIYGNRQSVQNDDDILSVESDGWSDEKLGPVSKFGFRLKGAIRFAIDGSPIETAEVPTVWDGFLDESQGTGSNPTIYSSVTQKLRKERGQNLDSFIATFMQSIEQSTDVGDDVMECLTHDHKNSAYEIKHTSVPSGRNYVFDDLFRLPKRTTLHQNFIRSAPIKGPSKCFLYIISNILNISKVLVSLMVGLIQVSESLMNYLISYVLERFIKGFLNESRLTYLINELENHIFDGDWMESEHSSTEIFERQRQAKANLQRISSGLGSLVDTLQSPTLNKHLMYCMLDIILIEIYPELESS